MWRSRTNCTTRIRKFNLCTRISGRSKILFLLGKGSSKAAATPTPTSFLSRTNRRTKTPWVILYSTSPRPNPDPTRLPFPDILKTINFSAEGVSSKYRKSSLKRWITGNWKNVNNSNWAGVPTLWSSTQKQWMPIADRSRRRCIWTVHTKNDGLQFGYVLLILRSDYLKDGYQKYSWTS